MNTVRANTGLATFRSATSVTSPVKIAKDRILQRKRSNAGRRSVKDADIVNAVYAHIQAIRALGKTTISPEEIARALDLPLGTIERSLASLTTKGVKVIRNG